MTGMLDDALRSVGQFIPKLLAFVAILGIGFLLSHLLRRLAYRGLRRMGLDRAVERTAVAQGLARANLDTSDVVAHLGYYAGLLFTAQLAFRVWGPNPIGDTIGDVVGWLPNAAVAIAIVVVTAMLAKRSRDRIAVALAGLSYGRPLARIASWAVLGLGAIAALDQVGVAATVTGPVLYAALGTLGGIAVVGLGGGLIRPMQRRWERWLDRADQESQAISERASAYAAGQRDARQATVYTSAAANAAASAAAAAGDPGRDENAYPIRTGAPVESAGARRGHPG